MFRRLSALGAYLIEANGAEELLSSVAQHPSVGAGAEYCKQPTAIMSQAFKRLCDDVEQLEIGPLAGSIAAKDQEDAIVNEYMLAYHAAADSSKSPRALRMEEFVAAFSDPIALPGVGLTPDEKVEARCKIPLPPESMN